MPVVFSEHARTQMRIRRIAKERVIKTVEEPQERKLSFKGRKLRRRLFGDKILQVVTITEGSKITIVSTYYLRKK